MHKVYTLCVGLCAFAGLWIMRAQEKQNPNFTGGNVTKLEEGTKATIAHFRFDPGSRTKWHSHEGGQIILVEEGVGRTQVKDGPVIELHAGETTYAKPGVAHWHGAAPDQAADSAKSILPSILGYKGFLILNPGALGGLPREVAVYQKRVQTRDGSSRRVLSDNGAIESFLAGEAEGSKALDARALEILRTSRRAGHP